MSNIFTAPLGLVYEIDDQNYITTSVTMDLNEIIDTNNEGFLDALSIYATDTELLMDIDYKLLRIDEHGALVFRVHGDLSAITDD